MEQKGDGPPKDPSPASVSKRSLGSLRSSPKRRLSCQTHER